jgi:hypothetical protein
MLNILKLWVNFYGDFTIWTAAEAHLKVVLWLKELIHNLKNIEKIKRCQNCLYELIDSDKTLKVSIMYYSNSIMRRHGQEAVCLYPRTPGEAMC